MVRNSRLLHTLRLISDTPRKSGHPTPATHPTSTTPTVLRSLPEHKPLLPLLLSYDIPLKLAEECATRYDKYASQLRSETETKLVPYFIGRRENPPATVYPMFLNNYNQTLRRWSQSILNIALNTLKRDSVELQNLEVSYPAPLWLPLPPSSVFMRKSTKTICPFSSISTPAHAFPTTYPPPLRPIPRLHTVEWPRKPAASPHNPPTSIIDLDSLCAQFAKSLVIGESPPQPRQPAHSIFLPSVVVEVGFNVITSSKRTFSRAKASCKLPTTKSSIPSPQTAKPRQLSAPPSFPPATPRIKPTPRKASTPGHISTSKNSSALPKFSDSPCHATLITSPSYLGTHTAGDSDTYSRLGPSTPRLAVNSALDRTTYAPQCLPYSLAGPTTPPTLLPNLLSEPIIVPSTPVRLSPRSSLMPITDPFLQFQPQSDYFSDPSLVSPFGFSGSIPEFATSGFFSKSVFDAPLWSDHLPHNTPAPIASDPFETNFFSTYTVS